MLLGQISQQTRDALIVSSNSVDSRLLAQAIHKLFYGAFILSLLIMVCSAIAGHMIIHASTGIFLMGWLLLMATVFFARRYLIKKNTPNFNRLKHLFLGATSISLGGLFTFTRYYFQIDHMIFFEQILTPLATSLLLIIGLANICALIFFNEYFRYLALYVFCGFAPMFVIYSSLFSGVFDHPLIIYVSIYILGLLMFGYYLNINNRRTIILEIENQKHIIYQTSQVQSLQIKQLELEQEVLRREKAESEVRQWAVKLEKLVDERTAELNVSNGTLMYSKQSLEIANKIAGIGTWDWDIKSNTLVLTNSKQILGYTNEELTQQLHNIDQIIHPNDIAAVKKSMQLHFLKRNALHDVQYRIRNSAGEWIWVHDIGQVIERDIHNNRATRMLGIRRDITREKEFAEKIKLSSSVFEHATQGFFVLDKNFVVLDMNQSLASLLGYDRDNFVSKHIFSYKHLQKSTKEEYLKILKTLVSYCEFEGESVVQDAQGKSKPVWIHINSVNDENQVTTHYVGIVSDLSQRKFAEKRLNYLANYDSLTELPNRNLFINRLHELILNSPKDEKVFALLRVNIDRFRAINDSLGADGADVLLKQFAKRLLSFDSEVHLVSRLSGDDFIIIVVNPRNDPQVLLNYAQNLIKKFQTPFQVNHQDIMASISVGIALFPDHGRQVDALLNHAENALSVAKNVGGQAARIYHSNSKFPMIDRLNLEQELRKALSNDELTVYFQPKTTLKENKIVGFEALVRWVHPHKGLISPIQFIQLAEENGLISTLGEIVLEKTCRQMKCWEEAGFKDIKVSVNIVVQQIQRGNIIENIDRILKETNINPSSLELEITESSLMNDTLEVNTFLSELKARNIDIALDDFGTGYSSLSYLGKYDIHTLKIDRVFVTPVGGSNAAHQEAIVMAILALAHSLNMRVVAEGVETEAHYNFLKQIGCDVIQGYLVSRPLPASEATLFLERFKQPNGDLIWHA